MKCDWGGSIKQQEQAYSKIVQWIRALIVAYLATKIQLFNLSIDLLLLFHLSFYVLPLHCQFSAWEFILTAGCEDCRLKGGQYSKARGLKDVYLREVLKIGSIESLLCWFKVAENSNCKLPANLCRPINYWHLDPWSFCMCNWNSCKRNKPYQNAPLIRSKS